MHYWQELSDDKWSVCGYVTVGAGCDSIVPTLIVDTVVYSTTDLELCYGDSTVWRRDV